MSHENATEEEIVPYLRVRVQPLQPLVLYGRAAGLDPKCHKQEAVYYGWREPKGPS